MTTQHDNLPCPFYIAGPFHDGTYAVCETASGRMLRVFRSEADLLLAAGTKRVMAPAFGIDFLVTAEAQPEEAASQSEARPETDLTPRTPEDLHTWRESAAADVARMGGVAQSEARREAQLERAALREQHPDDLLTVANIEPIDGGNTLTLLANDLGNLIDIAGEYTAVYRLSITGMKRADFEALEEFDGF